MKEEIVSETDPTSSKEIVNGSNLRHPPNEVPSFRKGETQSTDANSRDELQSQPLGHAEEASLLEPRWSLAFIGCLMYIVFEYLRVPAMFPILRPLALGKVSLGICAVGLLFERRGNATSGTPARLIGLMMLLVIFVGFISACFAQYQEEGWGIFLDLVKWSLTAYLIGKSATSSWRQRVAVFVFLLFNFKMAQAAVRHYAAIRAYGGNEEALAAKGVSAGSVGFFANSGDFGAAMCIVWALTGMLILCVKGKTWKALLVLIFVMFSGAIVASGSRGAFIGASVAALAYWLRNPSPRRIGALLLVICFIPGFYYILPEANKDRFRSLAHLEQDKTARIRMDLWRAGVNMFRDHPLIGVGPGNFGPTYDHRYAGPDRSPIVTAPHSIYVQNLAELGLAGCLPIVLIWVSFFWMNIQTRKRLIDRGKEGKLGFDWGMAMGLDLAMIAFLVSGAFATEFYFPHMWVLLGFGIGLNIASSRGAAEEPATETDPSPGLVPASG